MHSGAPRAATSAYLEECGVLAVVEGGEEGAQVGDGVDHGQHLGRVDDLRSGERERRHGRRRSSHSEMR